MVRARYSAVFKPFPLAEITAQLTNAEQRILNELKAVLEARLAIVIGTQYETLSSLRTKGHPYARSHFAARRKRDTSGRFLPGGQASPAAPPNYINAQSTNFYKSFEVLIKANAAGKLSLTLVTSMAQRSKWLTGGTKKMKGRRYGIPLYKDIPAELEAGIVKELSSIVAVVKVK